MYIYICVFICMHELMCVYIHVDLEMYTVETVHTASCLVETASPSPRKWGFDESAGSLI